MGAVVRTGRPPTHGDTGSPEFNAWQSMHQRCTNEKCRCYKNYGARGIKVCRRWQNYENFLADMGRRPSPEHSLERKNNNGNYCPANCVWATKIEQASNRRSNRVLNHGGRSQTLQAWARDLGTTDNALYMRLKKGWSVEKVLTTPIKQYRRRAV